ncbi:MAG: flagellar biosynthesis protein FlhA [Fuerstiella sp.]
MATSSSNLMSWNQRSETFLSLGLLGIVVIMLVPLPTFMLDLLLAINLSGAILLLLITLGVRRALDLSVFPSLLLVMTLYRLSLNVASTRRILLSADGGSLVDAFGSFVVGGNLVVGFVIFLILVLIQFIVITKGSGRVAEVSARFTLDALPGKQLAIDADLNAGALTEEEARKKRIELGHETEFYGAMDGASKFVRGDAIAGLIITAINLVGGIIIGVDNGLSLMESVQTYSILTIGDGLVSQIPALVISVSAGILVTKMTSGNSLGNEIGGQILENDRPIMIGVGFCGLLVLVPGLPKFPFIAIAAGMLVLLASHRRDTKTKEAEAEEAGPVQSEEASDENEADLRKFLLKDRATIEVGARLFGLVKPTQAKGLAERIRILRRELSQQRGLWIPPIRVRENFELDPESYQIFIAGRPVGQSRLRPDKKLAIPPENCQVELPGDDTQEPAFNLPARWIEPALSHQAESHGYTVVDPAGVLMTHLGELLKRHGHELITRETLKNMLDRVKEFAPTVVEELKSESVRNSLLHQVIRQLAADSVSLADFSLILEAIANHAATSKTADDLTDAVRMELGQVICQRFQDRSGAIRVIGLDPALETYLVNSVRDERLALPADTVESLVSNLVEQMQSSVRTQQAIVLIVHRPLRRPLKRLLASMPSPLEVISYQEVPETISMAPVGIVGKLDVALPEEVGQTQAA